MQMQIPTEEILGKLWVSETHGLKNLALALQPNGSVPWRKILLGIFPLIWSLFLVGGMKTLLAQAFSDLNSARLYIFKY